MPASAYTIGHSNHTIEKFVELLRAHAIAVIADVRSHPYSRFNPQFNRENLQAELRSADVQYVFLGKELGARSDDPACYVDGKVEYDRLAQSTLFQAGLERLVAGAQSHRVALMCAEKDPLTCHRAILVSRHLEKRGVTSLHILEDGQLENHTDAIARLRAELGLPERDLFRTREEIIHDAYAERGKEIAFTQERAGDDGPEGAVE
jgi:uncharacterized protein (DUF488 family)